MDNNNLYDMYRCLEVPLSYDDSNSRLLQVLNELSNEQIKERLNNKEDGENNE